jgi:predicted permease
MHGLPQDLRYALRQLRKNPGFFATALAILALAIGVNTAIFSVANALMLRSLPYTHPERIGTIFTRITGPAASDERHHLNGEQWELLRDQVPALISAVSGSRTSGINLEANSHTQYVQAGRISAHYLDVLATHPLIGRNFSEAEDIPHGPKVAILSYDLWRNGFDSRKDIVGQSILLKGEPYTVVGVLPQGATTPLNAQVYTALQPSREGEGSGTNFECITRVRDGATWQEADAQINRAWLHRSNIYELGDDPNATVSYYSIRLQRGQSALLRPQVLALMLAAGLILLIACANLAGLTLVRVLRRSSEIATRLALGASTWRVRKQLWIENVLLALLGGIAGFCTAFVVLRGLLLLLPEHFLPVRGISVDNRALAFALFVSLATSVLFGMLPAFATRKLDLRSAMASRASTSEGLTLRQALITGEVALTVVLVSASGLLVRTLIHLQTLPPGFDATNVMTARASLDDVRYHDAVAFRKLLEESTAAMRQIPGVQYAAVGLSLPYEQAPINRFTVSDGKTAGQQLMAARAYVTPDYFVSLNIPLLSGRIFNDGDGPGRQPVAIVNETFVRNFFHGENPIGLHLDKDTVIVGVVGDVAMVSSIDYVAPLSGEQMMYVPAAQMQAQELSLVHIWFQPSWIVRTRGPVDGLTAQMQHALASVDPDLPFSGFYNMNELLAKTLAMQRVEVGLLGTMAALAVLLSAVGIFGLVANIVTQKTREIGIRIALGSSIRQAMVQIGLTGALASVAGLIIGLILCAGVLRLMASVLYGVAVYDIPSIVSAVVVLASVTLIAGTVPTLRIARIDPAETLREE